MKERRTIFTKLVYPMLALLILQAVLYPVFFVAGGFFAQVRESSYDILNERVANRALYLKNEMLYRWSNLDESEEKILIIVGEVLEENGATYEDIRIDAGLNEEIIDALSEELIYLLRKNTVTGSFVILDGIGISSDATGSSRAGLYLRDMDPDSYGGGNNDLLMERGMPSISKRLGIGLDSFWSASFTIEPEGEDEKDLFFRRPLEAARTYESSGQATSRDFGYWSRPFSLNEDGNIAVTYSIPLIAENGTVFGVMGISLTENYLCSRMNYQELLSNKRGSYLLALFDQETSEITPMLESGKSFEQYFSMSQEISAEPIYGNSFYRLETEDGKSSEQIYASIQPLSNYGSNTPYPEDNWVLIGIAEESKIMYSANRLVHLFGLLLLVSILIGIAGAVVVSRMISRPIRRLAEEVKNSNPRQRTRLPKLRIKEIDRLTGAIEELSDAVADSASRISKIAKMTGIRMAVFEYHESADRVFCSDGLGELLDWKEFHSENGEVQKEDFLGRMEALQVCLYREDIYCFEEEGGNRYVRINQTVENGSHLGTVIDVTRETNEKLKIEYERNYDILTNLLNRRAFDEEIRRLFEKPVQLKIACLIMWDLDNLKLINDTYGHDCGDWYICGLADCLREFEKEGALVSRRSGDEFYTFHYGFSSREELRIELRRIWARIGRVSLQLPGEDEIKIRVSAGAAWYPYDTENLENLKQYADYAMYEGKHSKKGMLIDFNRAGYERKSLILKGPEQLNRLLEQKLVRFAFQPIVSAKTAEIYGYELLMRPQMKELSTPMEVIQMAGAHSKLYQVERLTWFEGMKAFYRQKEAGNIPKGTKVFVNSIPNVMLTPQDLEDYRKQFGDEGREELVLELTESQPLDTQMTMNKMQDIRRGNGMVALDDYGSGYSSESVLMEINPDIIKLDICLVHNVDKDGAREEFLKNLIVYARKRGIQVIAEGIETKEELEVLLEAGADYLQGYYLGKPSYEISPVSPEAAELIRNFTANGRGRTDGQSEDRNPDSGL